MQFLSANMWDIASDATLVTTNGVLKKDGTLVMGAGVALQAALRNPYIPKILGKHVSENGNIPLYIPEAKIISFPTKHHWKDNSDIDLIIKSANLIVSIVNEHNLKSIVSSKPGCGLGGLNWEEVKSHLENIFDDRFTIVRCER
jgi:hypothetical protein